MFSMVVFISCVMLLVSLSELLSSGIVVFVSFWVVFISCVMLLVSLSELFSSGVVLFVSFWIVFSSGVVLISGSVSFRIGAVSFWLVMF